MPTYEYHCPACKATYELRQSFSAEVTHACEECGRGTAKRVLHAPRVVFKGSGWYVKDSASKNPALANDTKSESTDSAPASEGAKSSKEKASKAAPAAAPAPASSSSSSEASAAS